MEKTLTQTDYKIFLIKTLGFLGLAWALFCLTLSGLFYTWIPMVLIVLAGTFITYCAYKGEWFSKISRELWISSLAILAIVVFFSFFSAPTIFSGRDQGSISEAAMRLSQNHKLEFATPASQEFFKIYGVGKALNFPGFYYTPSGQLTTQFPLVYIAWLAFFYGVFGLVGFTIANSILLYMFLLTFYLLARVFIPVRFSILTLAFTLTSFAFIWFSKFTLSENMALPLVWLSILSIVLFVKNPSGIYYSTLASSSILMCFTRIEGFALLFSIIIILLINEQARNYMGKHVCKTILLPIAIFSFFFFVNGLKDFYFYKEIIKAILPASFFPQAKTLGIASLDSDALLPDFYLGKVLYIYGMLSFFVLGFISLAILIFKKRRGRLMTFFVILPTFLYLFDFHITPDHPWMLRRFVFTLFPAAILYSALLLTHWHKHIGRKTRILQISIISILIAIMLSMNIPAFFEYATFYENKGLLDQVKNLSRKFSPRDLILVDRLASGDSWTMITAPMSILAKENAVYFFNTNDLSRLDLSKFENIYLMTSNDQSSIYFNSTISKRLNPYLNYSFQTTRLSTENESQQNQRDIILLPQKKQFSAEGKIFKISK